MKDKPAVSYVVAHEQWCPRCIMREPTIDITDARTDEPQWRFQVVELRFTEPRPATAIEVRVLDDGFGAFTGFRDFFAALAAKEPDTLPEVVSILRSLGAADVTDRNGPHAPARHGERCKPR